MSRDFAGITKEAMSEFQWLIGRKIKSVSTDEGQNWYFSFHDGGALSVHSPWRVLVGNKIAASSDDHGQKFGLPQAIDSEKKAFECLSPYVVTKIHVCEGTLDLNILFEDDVELQIIQLSSGYEAWQITGPNGENAVAQGGGKLH